jgi:hypothetical protein
MQAQMQRHNASTEYLAWKFVAKQLAKNETRKIKHRLRQGHTQCKTWLSFPHAETEDSAMIRMYEEYKVHILHAACNQVCKPARARYAKLHIGRG